jgi:hypothetical protein
MLIYYTECQHQEPWPALSTDCGNKRNKWSCMQMCREFYTCWSKGYPVVVLKPYYHGTIYILQFPWCQDNLLYVLYKNMHSSGKHIYGEIWSAEWWQNMWNSCHVISQKLFLVRCSLCLGELKCQREHATEIMTQNIRYQDHISEISSERLCVRDCFWEIITERMCLRDRVGGILATRSSLRYCVREIMSDWWC